MTFGWRHVWTTVAILIGGCVAFFAISIWHANSESQGKQLDRSALPVMSGLASDDGDYKVRPRPGGCALPNANVNIAAKTVSPKVLSKLSGVPEWQLISQHMKPGDEVHTYSSHLPVPKGVSMLIGVSVGYLVLRGPCLVGMYANREQLVFMAPSP